MVLVFEEFIVGGVIFFSFTFVWTRSHVFSIIAHPEEEISTSLPFIWSSAESCLSVISNKIFFSVALKFFF